jgi:hypothetical protein
MACLQADKHCGIHRLIIVFHHQDHFTAAFKPAFEFVALSEAPPAEQETSDSPLEVGLKKVLDVFGFLLSLCPAPSIGEAGGKKHADCLSPLLGGTRRRSISRFGDAQG